MNKPTYGSQPIKNEQSGYQPTIDTMNPTPPQGNLDAIVFQEELLESQIQRILTAAKVSTLDEVIERLEIISEVEKQIVELTERYQPLESQVVELLGVAKCNNVLEVVQMFDRHPLSPEDIERAASKYAFENNTHRSNSKAFIVGANFAKQHHKLGK